MLFPYTESRRIALRPAGAADGTQAYRVLFRAGRANLPLLDQFCESFGRRLAACFLIHRVDGDDAPIGLGTLSDLSPAGHLRAEVVLTPGQPEELLGEASALIVNFAFAMWRTRKVYLHANDADPASVGFGGEHAALARAEAVLEKHTFGQGRLWDVHVFAVHREQWDTTGVDLLKQLV
ncbi:GNAT family protein [Salinispora pacifica]|uniref:GNAT family protein n=1 Tax=Salinispora pacifica TaxID=351187 RepID=UPI0004BA9F78|nr:GNAT family protein [Salinispora pacifica]